MFKVLWSCGSKLTFGSAARCEDQDTSVWIQVPTNVPLYFYLFLGR
jgi:hypothetical protein